MTIMRTARITAIPALLAVALAGSGCCVNGAAWFHAGGEMADLDLSTPPERGGGQTGQPWVR